MEENLFYTKLKNKINFSYVEFDNRFNEIILPFSKDPELSDLGDIVNDFGRFLIQKTNHNFYVFNQNKEYDDFTKMYFYMVGKSFYDSFISGDSLVSLYDVLGDFECFNSDFMVDNYSMLDTVSKTTENGARIRIQNSYDYDVALMTEYYSKLKNMQ